MRKSSKLLAVLLTLCLLFGAITAIVASAADEATMPTKGDIDPVKTSNKTYSKNGNHVVHGTYSAAHDVKKFDYITVDFDLVNNNDTFSTVTLTWSFAQSTDNTKDIATKNGWDVPSCGSVKIDAASDGNFYVHKDTEAVAIDEDKLFPKTSGSSAHFTMVYQITHGSQIVITPHLFYNQKHFGQLKSTSLDTADSKGLENYIQYYRVNVGKFTGTGGNLTLKDFTVNYYNKGSEKAGDVADFLAPYLPHCQIGIEVYTKVEDAMAALRNITDEEEITVSGMNLADVVVPEGLTSFTVTCKNGGTFSLSADCAYVGELVDDTTTYTAISNDHYFVQINGGENITSMDDAKAALKNITDGAEIVIEGMDLSNTEVPEGAKSFTVTTREGGKFTIAGDRAWRYAKIGNTYKRVIDGDIKANLDISSTDMRFNIYVPYVEGLSFNVAYDKGLTAVDTYVKDGGVREYDTDGDGVKEKYTTVYWTGRMDYLTSEKVAYVEFQYTEDSTTVNFEALFAAKFNYIKYVTIAATDAECGSEDARLIRAITDYRVEFYKHYKTVETEENNKKNGTNNVFTYTEPKAVTDFYAIYTAHGEGCTCDDYFAEDKDLSADQKYIEVGTAHGSEHAGKVTFGLTLSSRTFYMFVNAEKNQLVSISYGKGEPTEAYTNAETGIAMIGGIDAAALDNDFVITIYSVTYENGTDESGKEIQVPVRGEKVIEFNYSIFDYTPAAEHVGIIAALKNYAIAAENFKKYVPEA